MVLVIFLNFRCVPSKLTGTPEVRGAGKPVKTFKVDRRLYNANKKMDRDQDSVACEKR